MNLHSGMILRKSNHEIKVLNTFRWIMVIVMYLRNRRKELFKRGVV